MKKSFFILLLLCVCVLCAYAETIILLRTGARVEGTIVFENEEVVIVKTAEGRFQYPRSEILGIGSDDSERVKELRSEGVKSEELIDKREESKKVSALLELAGGAGVQPGEQAGGGASVDLLIGTHHIGKRHLFIGAGLGYHGLFLGKDSYHFLPVQVALRMPLIEAKHAPVFGVALGYGAALNKQYKGGLYAGLDFGYRYRVNPKTSIAIVAFANFQQAEVKVEEEIEDMLFVHAVGRNLVMTGIKIGFYF